MKKMRLFLCLACLVLLLSGGCGEKKESISCEISVSCEEILLHYDQLNAEKKDLVPQSGILLEEQTVSAQEGESAFDILLRTLKEQKLHIDAESGYIKGIGNIYEKDCGDFSGWLYTVNGNYAEVGANDYYPEEGDKIVWYFMTGLEE